MITIVLLLILGLIAGVFSGLIGVGGGIIIVPVLTLFFGFTQKLAQGTTLALLLPPIGLLAVYTYYKSGYVDVKAAILICLGFILGGLVGAKIAVNIPNGLLVKLFGSVMIILGIYTVLKK